MSRYRDWGSEFYNSVFANPAPDPLEELQEVYSTSVLGASALLKIASLKDSCNAIVKLSQEGSTYYSSIRDTSSAGRSGSYTAFPPVQTPTDKVASWKTAQLSQDDDNITRRPPNYNNSEDVDANYYPPTRRPHPTSAAHSSAPHSGPHSSAATTNTAMRPPQAAHFDVPRAVDPQSPAAAVRAQSPAADVRAQSPAVSSMPRRPRAAQSAAGRGEESNLEEDPIVIGLRGLTVPPDQIKIYIKNVPDKPHTKENINHMLQRHIANVYLIEHCNTTVCAITDRQGSHAFRDDYNGRLLDTDSGNVLVVTLID